MEIPVSNAVIVICLVTIFDFTDVTFSYLIKKKNNTYECLASNIAGCISKLLEIICNGFQF